METELIRFRIDPQLAQQAEKACADAGFELRDVLRLVVTRMAREHALPFGIDAVGTSEARRRPFYEYVNGAESGAEWRSKREPVGWLKWARRGPVQGAGFLSCLGQRA